MSATARGISDHEAVEIFERWHQILTRHGCDDRQASRVALYAVYRHSGAFDDAQAWEAVEELFPKHRPVERESTDKISIDLTEPERN